MSETIVTDVSQVLKKARAGDPYAMVEAGRLYRDGIGVRRNCFRAWKWFEKGNRKGLGMGGLMSQLMLESLPPSERRRIDLLIRLYAKHDAICWCILAAVLIALLTNTIIYIARTL